MSANKHELERFTNAWSLESRKTLTLLESLPPTQYDYRPDMTGRSLGELAWHLAEVEAYVTHGIEVGRYDLATRPPGVERPREVASLAPGYRRVHDEAFARVRNLRGDDLGRRLRFFNGQDMRIGELLWGALLHHLIHHRGQLTLMCRLAGGKVPGLYGPTREEMAALRANLQAKS